jgi:putative ABC transport system permease protein
VLGRGLRVMAAGIAIGIASAWASTRALQSLLFGVGSMDLRTFAAVVVCLMATAFAACYLPARRAAHLDPIAVLRDQ